MSQKIKILIANDGSKSAMDAVKYCSRFFDPQITEMTLIHILVDMPDALENFLSETSMAASDTETDISSLKKKNFIQQKIEESVSILENAGYDQQSVTVKVQNQAKTVAKDIIAESEKGYDALVIGRRGLNDPTNIIVGATAYRMMKAIQHLPVVIVGEDPDPENILIGSDGSENSLKALDCVSKLMLRPSRKILLCHIAQRMEKEVNENKALTGEELNQQLETQCTHIKTLMQKTEDCLVKAGFDQALIEKEILEGIISRAVAISKTAESHNCGSVVVGRRGLSIIREFMIGRVTMKILHKAHKQAVWVV